MKEESKDESKKQTASNKKLPPVTEKLLQYIWQFQYFTKSYLKTAKGEQLQIILPGKLNANQGPDFLEAQIRIDNTILAGSVELHLKTGQWNEHGHQHDPNFKNVILHVVYEHDNEVSLIPVLELQERIPKMLLQRYELLMHSQSFIPCSSSIAETKEIIWFSWKERLLAERLTRKSKTIFQLLERNNFHWEEAFWWLLARNFGATVNSDAFESIAMSIPFSVLAKHRNRPEQLEALLFGQAGLLHAGLKDDHPKLLFREYGFLKKKYGLLPAPIPVHFLRMRPGNFPTIRLAQLAALLQHSAHLFSSVLEMDKVWEAGKLLEVSAAGYWDQRYRFDELSPARKKNLGKGKASILLINTVIPMLFAYGLHHKDEKYKVKALLWLDQLKAENNHITEGFMKLKLANKSAFDSQAMIELKTQYCDHKHCLKCAVGNGLLKNY
jgi:hypothetical protein